MSITPIDPLEKYIETLRQSTAQQQAKEKAITTKFYDDQADTVRNLYSGEVDKVGQAYADQERQNSIQKLINERAVAERAENLGLTDSGLNRTQQTAVQLSYANNQSKIAQQKQAAIDSLNSQMAAKIAELEGNKSAALAGIDSEYEKLIHDNAVSARNADLDSYNKLVEAEAKAQTNYQKKKSTDYSNLYKHISENNDDPDYVAKLIDEYASLYDIDETGAEFKALLKAAGITIDEMDRYIEKGSIYSTGKEYNDLVGSDLPIGRVQWDYKKDGQQNYKIQIVKATKNRDNFFGLFDTVDRNDIVNIYYPDGTLLASNVKLKDLTKENAKKITHFTDGKTEGGTPEVLSLDLSEENFK